MIKREGVCSHIVINISITESKECSRYTLAGTRTKSPEFGSWKHQRISGGANVLDQNPPVQYSTKGFFRTIPNSVILASEYLNFSFAR